LGIQEQESRPNPGQTNSGNTLTQYTQYYYLVVSDEVKREKLDQQWQEGNVRMLLVRNQASLLKSPCR
jgi:hypothetical protein